MTNQLFKDKLLNDKFCQEGYIYYNKTIIGADTINNILEKFINSNLKLSNYNKELHTIETKEKEELKQFSYFIENSLDKIIREIFYDIEFVFSMIVSKAPNSKDILHLHQDASFIDEEYKENIGITF